MKLCPTCGQPVAEEIGTCPACGRSLGQARQYIDDYRIVAVLHEGYSTFLCRAIREKTDEHVMIRLFTPRSGVNAETAARLQREIEELTKLPGPGLVRHYAIRRSGEGLWYRISEWVEAENWGSLLASGRLADRAVLLDLFRQTAEILAVLHRHGHFIPHLILNDIMVLVRPDGALGTKIDYKLSRYIDPKFDRPGPMLKKLLTCHPDILNERPLDYRSDIWSLGKIFVELLAADLEVIDYPDRIAELNLPEELEVLLRVMLAEDPDLRPQSMAEVAASLARIATTPARVPPLEAVPAARPGKPPRRRLRAALAAAFALSLVVLSAWLYLERGPGDTETVLETYANQYARSVAFVLVEYWIEHEGKPLYRNVSEGTAFLVDREGYLLTSRHVVCPWLEDPRFPAAAQYLRQQGREPVFGYRIFLWFEGRRAFNLSGRLIEDPDVADIYFTENAYSTEAAPRVGIAGVAKPPVRTRQLFTSPLKDDFAVIKIEGLPPQAAPLPLDLDMTPRQLPKLSRVIALGFPLGSRTQADTVNASVVRGNVRRAFENMFQIDASLHGGNSGGPVIDARGRVIGIVSAVAVDFTQGMVPMVTPVWDIGLILPITEAVKLLLELKAGQAKWNGVVDFAEEAALAAIRQTAARGRWAEALAAAEAKLGKNPQPAMVTAAGMLHLCAADYTGARRRFVQALSMDAEDHQARLMLALIDRLSGDPRSQADYRDLGAADWRSPAEFQGYLLNLLEGRVALEEGLQGGTSGGERDWLRTIGGILLMGRGRPAEAQSLLEPVVLAADTENWAFFLARAKLEEIRRQGRAAPVEPFERKLRESLEARRARQAQLGPLWSRLAAGGLSLDDRREVLAQIAGLDPENQALHGILAYLNAAAGDFPGALERLRAYQSAAGRVTAMRLSLGLLEAGLLHHQGAGDESRERLEALAQRTRDPGYLAIADFLDGRSTEDALRRQIGDSPEYTLAAFAAAGFWAEGSQDRKNAMRFYREALGTFLDNWIEYDFVRERVKNLKRMPGG